MPSPRMTLARGLAVVAALAIVAGACTSRDDSPEKPAAGDPPATSTPDPTVTPPIPSESPTEDPAQAPVTGQLLTASLVPGLNPKWHWRDGETGKAGTDPFGACARADLAGIGATEVLERTFFPPDDSDDSAAQQLATFADATSTAQAWSVLEAWRNRCAATLGRKVGPKVGAMTAVGLPDGSPARWYLVSWTPAGEETGRFEQLGMIRNGNRISVLRITSSGQDFDYPAGREPMVTMVKRAAPGVTAGVGTFD